MEKNLIEKNREAVDLWYSATQHSEFIVVNILNKNMPVEWVIHGYFFEIQCNDKFGKNDVCLCKINPDRTKKIITKIEVEWGRIQYHWDKRIPQYDWYGLNLLYRKDYGVNFSFFLKASITFDSFFIVDCRDNFIDMNFNNTLKARGHGLSFTTNGLTYQIDWNALSQYYYIDDEYFNSENKDNMRVLILEDLNNGFDEIYKSSLSPKELEIYNSPKIQKSIQNYISSEFENQLNILDVNNKMKNPWITFYNFIQRRLSLNIKQ